MIKLLKKIDYRYYLCIILTLLFLLYSFKFLRSYIRIWESIKDLGLSIYYYASEIFEFKRKIEPTINNVTSSSSSIINNIFLSFKGFKSYFILSFNSLLNLDTLIFYIERIMQFIKVLFKFLLLIIPIFLILIFYYKRYFKENDKQINDDSKPLKIYKLIKLKIVIPIVNWLKKIISFIQNHHYFITIWIIIWLFYFNIFTIIIEFLAFYFYFVMSFDFVSIFIQVYKLFLDLLPMIIFVPFPIWIIFGLILFNRFRKNIALNLLNHHEMMNRGFINEMGLSSMICGTMGTGKTKSLTDIGLSQAVMFRDKAFELILSNDLKFPNFTFAVFENEIKIAMNYHEIYNLATCKKWLKKKIERFNKNPCNEKIFDYDYKKYGLTYWNGAEEIHLFEMLENYVQLYFIYTIESSLLITNYSIREDSILQDLGNFPMWHNDFFNTNKEYVKAYSRHSHILDFDMLRLGKTIIKNNKNRDAFEFGVVLVTEGGKERGNMIENRGLKKDEDSTNRMNDLFNTWLKMLRHSATVDNFPFIKVIFDEQRPESMGADVREVCDKIIYIEDKGEVVTPLMLFKLETMIYEFLNNKISDIYYRYRFVRSDNTLFMYLLKNIWGHYFRYYDKLKNQFSYQAMVLSSKKGTLDVSYGKSKYYISHKKIYSRRYATDAFNDYFMQKSSQSEIGLNDIQTYATESATLEELQLQNSYFIIELMRIRRSLKEKK